MFTWVGHQFDAILSTYVLGVVSIADDCDCSDRADCMTIWVTLYGWAVLRNEVSETLPTFMWKVFKIGLVWPSRCSRASTSATWPTPPTRWPPAWRPRSCPLQPRDGDFAVCAARQVQRRRQPAGP
jgi:hypothetical protein